MESLLQQLDGHVAGCRIQEGLAVLQQIKIAMLTQQPTLETTLMYVKALESGILLSVASEDLDAFQRNMQQLQPLYAATSTVAAGSSISPHKNHILGLNLMLLLVENRLSEFHSELELLSSDLIEHDKFINFPVSLERKMMVGIYDEVLEMTLPDPSYQFFMNQLFRTVRDCIADCMEVSYQSLSVEQAIELMKCSDETDLMEYVSSARSDWIVDDETNTITFQPDAVGIGSTLPSVSPIPTHHELPKMKWIQQALSYATELERIV